jgi:hypothetical protein
MSCLVVTNLSDAIKGSIGEACVDEVAGVEELHALLIHVVHQPLCTEQVLEDDIIYTRVPEVVLRMGLERLPGKGGATPR